MEATRLNILNAEQALNDMGALLLDESREKLYWSLSSAGVTNGLLYYIDLLD